jgi:hypothetical protein
MHHRRGRRSTVIMIAVAIFLATGGTAPAAPARLLPQPERTTEGDVLLRSPRQTVDPSIVDGSAERKLDQARSRWAATGLSSYRFSVAMRCFFCPTELGRPTSITVRHSRAQHPPADLRSVSTVPHLFRIVERAIDDRVRGLDVTYGTRGLPREISTDGPLEDDGVTVSASRLRPLPR